MYWSVGPTSPLASTFQRQYKAFTGAFVEKAHLDEGGKIILPNSAMHELAHLNVVWPMKFKISSSSSQVSTHCGVLEFSAQEGHAYIPYWMMQHLRIQPGTIIKVQNASLPKGTFVKLRPQTKDFIEDISNPRPVLEAKLRNFACLTKGDTVIIAYNDKHYCIDIMEVRSNAGNEEAVCIIDTDVVVDFERPADMPESPREKAPGTNGASSLVPASETPLTFSNAHLNRQKAKKEEEKPPEPEPTFKAFTGAGRTMSGKPVPQASPSPPLASPAPGSSAASSSSSSSSAVSSSASAKPAEGAPASGFKSFTGTGRSLK
eukprot:EG_transcript_13015